MPRKIEQEKLTLPQGGGSVTGLGESFEASAFSGTAGVSIPVYTTPARALSPTLALEYGSGGGNGPFGLGCSLALGSVSRQTRLRIPRYDDTDVFVLGERDLTPRLAAGAPVERRERVRGVEWTVREFVPRVQESLELVERWTADATGESFWRTVDPAGLETLYGATPRARIADPSDPARIFEWLVEEARDPLGNRIEYTYRPEDRANVPDTVSEAGHGTGGNRYPAAIRYGNYVPEGGGEEAFAFEIVFDYGERDLDGADPARPLRGWAARADPFSSYRSGFEIRTLRLCRGVLVFHRFPAELGAEPCLVRATRFAYDETPTFSFLRAVTQEGFRRGEDGALARAALPPLTLAYSTFSPPPAPAFAPLEVAGGAWSIPAFLEGGDLQAVDLDGEGLPGLLYADGTGTFYYRPLGDGVFGPPEAPAEFPSARRLEGARESLRDLDGDGLLELVVRSDELTGYFPREDDGRWGAYRSFTAVPSAVADPAAESADLDGDGRADLLTFDAADLVYYPSAGTEGFGSPVRRLRAPGFPMAARGEREVVLFADVFGDGLQHRLRVRDGIVEAWPNLGYGRFGERIVLGNAPRFADGVSAPRVYLADVDGSGTSDLVFAYADRVEVHRNQSGNSFAPPLPVPLPTRYAGSPQLTFADVRGTGSTALIVSAPDPAAGHWFVEFPGAAPAGSELPGAPLKPYLLTRIENGLGGATELRYASSTRFYLDDRRAGRPWATRLPFPVPVVEEAVTTDAVAGTRLQRRWRYHDGCWDAVERTFNGFGYVESWDAQTLPGPMPPGALLPAGVVPAAHTRTWFHTGTVEDAAALQAQYRAEYFSGDPEAFRMPDSGFDPAIAAAGPTTVRQAYAALKGRELRQEVYGLDGSALEGVPFTVSERSYEVRLLQGAEPGAAASVFVRDRESVASDYERDPADPRIRHEVFLDTTLFAAGGATEYRELRCTVFYPRRPAASPSSFVYPEQAVLRGEASEGRFTRVTEPFRRVGDPFESRRMELSGLHLPPGERYFSVAALRTQVDAALAAAVPYGVPLGTGPGSRPMAWERSYFWNEAQDAALPLGQVTARALEHHAATAVWSDEWLGETFGDRVDPALLRDQGGYLRDPEGTWWNRGLVRHYGTDAAGFFLPVGVRNDFAWEALAAGETPAAGLFVESTAAWDAPYALALVREARIPGEGEALATTAAIDYQAMAPWETVDPNGVVRQALPDPLGRVLATSVFKPAAGERSREGDGNLRDYVVRQGATFRDVLARKPFYLQDASTFFFYGMPRELDAQPASTIRLARTVHVSELPPGEPGPIEAEAAFTDGLGRLAQSRTEAEPGPALAADGAGGIAEVEAEERWIVSGAVVYNNKGLPAEVYLPFYAATAEYEDPGVVAAAGAVPPPTVNRYDPLGRAVRVDTPKGFFARTAFTPWSEARYDENDTVRQSEYYRAHIGDPATPPAEREALEQAARCENTPAVTVRDNTGAPIREIASNLGDVPPDAFAVIVAGSGVSSQALWADLVARGYLATSETPPAGTWITERFRPYVPGFALELAPEFEPFAPAVTEMLRQGGLESFVATDAEGREVETTDPRLFYGVVTGGEDAFSFRYAYPMGSDVPARTRSADAGDRRALPNVFGGVVAAWDGRGGHVAWSYDPLLRPLAAVVTEAQGASRTAEAFEYGEGAPDAVALNLRGRLWRSRDGAGVETIGAYTFQGEAAATERQFCADYRAEPDWSGAVPLDPEVYRTQLAYDALLRPTARTTPDGATWRAEYHLSGRLRAVSLADAGRETSAYVVDVEYTAGDERLRVEYGNGVVQESGYEWTTRRLLTLRATRPTAAVRGEAPSAVVQDDAYTYDPVGNVTLAVDRSAETVFCFNQEVEPRAAFVYDPLYRLVSASGRQHPGITATTHLTGFKQSLFAELCPAAIADAVKLERYDETYRYDDSGNRVELRHTAKSASFTRATPVEAASNRLAGVPYDGDGNPLALSLINTVGLAWDFRDQLRTTTTIERPGGKDDAEWLCYDASGNRVRRVVERVGQGGAVVEVRDTRYLGTFRVSRTSQRSDTETRLVEERQSLQVMEDGDACAAVRLAWTVDLLGRGAPAGTVRERFQVAGRMGSVSVELDRAAAVLSYEEYYPFGGTSLIAGPSVAEVEPKERRYSGEEADDSTGLYDYGARLYAPWLGRWLTPDPDGPVDGLNLFAFVEGNPTSYVDEGGTGKVKPQPKAKKAKPAKPAKQTGVAKSSILIRKGTPTPWARRMMKAGTADYDTAVLKRASNKKLPNIHAAHRLSDKAIRTMFHRLTLTAGASSTSTSGTLVTPTSFLATFKSAVWDPAGQTKAQVKKVEAGFTLLQNSITSGTSLTSAQMDVVATTATVISNTSLKNLYPGDASHNMSRGEAPDFRTTTITMTTGTTTKLQRRLTPTSEGLAEMIRQARAMDPTLATEKSLGWDDPKKVPATYTSSAKPK